MFGGFTLAPVLNKAFYTTSDTYALWQRILKNVYKLRYTTNTMVSFFCYIYSCILCSEKEKKYVQRGTLWAWRFQFVKLHPGEIGLSFRMSSLKTWNYLILCKSALCEKIQSALSLPRRENVIFILAITTVIWDSEVSGKISGWHLLC